MSSTTYTPTFWPTQQKSWPLSREGHEGIRCGWLLEHAGRPCDEPATYLAAGTDLVADSTRVGARGDVESGAQWLCREHLELILDGASEDQPIFGHITGE